jgi:NAD(P)-dependent dehydrogenase (short-subunit alcohol dehydrogenase family)
VHGRSKVKVDATLSALAGELPGAELEGVSFDLGRPEAVKNGATQILARVPALHVLVNNAGIFASERAVNEQGAELTMAVNYLGGFMLAELLKQRLMDSATEAPSRVINVSSIAHARGRIHLDDLSLANAWTGYAAYAQAKLAQVMHAISLAEKSDPKKLVAFSLHPGVISTKLLRQGFGPVAGASAEAGAKTSVMLAGQTSVEEPSGTYYSEGVASKPAQSAYDEATRQQLWLESIRYAGL